MLRPVAYLSYGPYKRLVVNIITKNHYNKLKTPYKLLKTQYKFTGWSRDTNGPIVYAILLYYCYLIHHRIIKYCSMCPNPNNVFNCQLLLKKILDSQSHRQNNDFSPWTCHTTPSHRISTDHYLWQIRTFDYWYSSYKWCLCLFISSVSIYKRDHRRVSVIFTFGGYID